MPRQQRDVHKRAATVLGALVFTLAALITSGPVQAIQLLVGVTTANWNEPGGFVDLQGTSNPRATVFITDADSGNVLSTITATAEGTWSIQVTDFASVPCRVRAASGGATEEAEVLGAPGDCGPRPLAITTANWDPGTERLLVNGQSDTYRRIVVKDADSGAELAIARSDAMGIWAAEIADLSPVSCAVTAESDIDLPVEAAVAGNPSSCGPPLQGARLYAENLCQVCHGDDGAGNPTIDIQGKSASDIHLALLNEAVHDGIDATMEEADALAVFLDAPWPLPAMPDEDFSSPAKCRVCHPRQYKEWSGDIMAYSAVSPTFSALESLGSSFSKAHGGEGFAAGTHATALFCENCHNPVSGALGQFPTLAESNGRPMRDFADDVGIRGISCEVCHQVSGPNPDDTFLGRLGDGISNNAFLMVPGHTKFGPLSDPQPNPEHDSAFSVDLEGNDGYLRSSEFCGACHDVRTPPGAGLTEDPLTGEPFQRLENLFTEWKNGPYGPINNQVGGVVSCQDCHMDVGPPAPAATYPSGATTVYPRPSMVTERDEVSTHYFTGVDIALVDFPGQDDTGLDEHGNVIGQIQRRQILLESAANLSITAPAAVTSGGTLQLFVNVTNSGTGHNLPSGFSQERQMWVELTVKDAAANVVYQSGHLEDSTHPETGELVPDGNLDDEDLLNFIGTIDPITLEADVVHGPDFDRRHEHPPVYQGIANFGNEFKRVATDAMGNPVIDPATGEIVEEEVFMPFLSNHTDNSFSIPALHTENVRYDIDIPVSAVGPLTITSRLRFRALPPRFLRTLSAGRPDLVTEAIVDRNRIVNMVEATPVSVEVGLSTVFADGFETGNTERWSETVPPPG